MEENNFGVRKRLLEYDDVMNIQREAIYTKRNNALTGERLAVDLNNMFQSLTENMVLSHRRGGNFESFRRASLMVLGFDPQMEESVFSGRDDNAAVAAFQQTFDDFYHQKEQRLIETLLPIVKDIYEREGDRFSNVAIPFVNSRGMGMQVGIRIKAALESDGASMMRDIERAITLAIIDERWKEHLRAMDELKTSVQAASFEQKDPLVVYKMQAYELFEGFIYQINEDVTSWLSTGRLYFPPTDGNAGPAQAPAPRPAQAPSPAPAPRLQTNRGEAPQQDQAMRRAMEQAGGGSAPAVTTVKREQPKVGRNEPCPCGSGKKFKQCHGR